jgi:IPT/TIG domain
VLSGAVGTSVTISGSNYGLQQGSSTVTFNGTAAIPTSWSVTTIVVPVPSGATTGNVIVSVGGVASNGVSFWDFATGKAVAISPEIPPLLKTAPHFGDFPPSLQLSPDGKYVLVSWGGYAEPVVYEVPQP